MASPKIKFKRSSVASKRPTLSNLELGEVALNTYDGKLFLRQDTGGVGIATTITSVNPWQESYGGGTITYDGNVNLDDNGKLQLGDGQDLQIYHNGTHSYIDDAGTGNLHLRSGTLSIQNLAGNKTSAVFNSGSGQELYHDNSKKFETTGAGVTVFGTTQTQQLNVSGISTFTGDVSFGSTTNIVKKVTDINSWVIKDTSFSVSAQQTAPLGLYFKPDGTKMFVTGTQSPRDVEEYGLSSAWDITSASHTTAYSVSSQDTAPQGLFFSPNGENMFFVGSANDNVYHYTLSTGWDLSSTITYVGSFDVSSQDNTPTGLTFGDSGTKMYVVGRGNDSIYQYNLSSAYTITSGVGIAHTLNIGASSIIVPDGFGNPQGISISSDGTKIWIVGTGEDRISQINLSTAYDLSTASYSNDLVGIGWYSTNPNDIYVNESAEKAFVVDSGGDDIHEIDITTSGLSVEANPTAESANINLNNNVQVKGRTWFDDRIFVNGSGTSWFQHNVQIQGTLTLRGVVDIGDGNGDRIQFGGSDDAKIYYDGTDNFFDLVFSSADNNGLRILDSSESELLRVTNDGKVGLGSASPTAKLDVNGDANISGVVTATSFSGDGSSLTNVSSNIGIQSASVTVGTGVTNINFTGTGLTVTASGNSVTVDIPSSSITRQLETVSGVTTDFTITGGYVTGLIDVYVNGSKQAEGTDFTATDGLTVTMTPFVEDGDVVEFQKHDRLSIAGIDTTTNATNAYNFVGSAFYLPQYTTTARDAASFNEGAMIYNLTSKKINFYDGTNWIELPGVTLGLGMGVF